MATGHDRSRRWILAAAILFTLLVAAMGAVLIGTRIATRDRDRDATIADQRAQIEMLQAKLQAAAQPRRIRLQCDAGGRSTVLLDR